MFNKKDPEESANRRDHKSTPMQDSEDAMEKQRVEDNKHSAKIKKIAEDIEQGP